MWIGRTQVVKDTAHVIRQRSAVAQPCAGGGLLVLGRFAPALPGGCCGPHPAVGWRGPGPGRTGAVARHLRHADPAAYDAAKAAYDAAFPGGMGRRPVVGYELGKAERCSTSA